MTNYQAADTDRMFCYLWWEVSNPAECKFGERWVFAGQDPHAQVLSRVKDSLGVRKDILKDGGVVIERIWDVSSLARDVGRLYKGARMDDYIRPQIGHRKGKVGEIHSLPADEVVIRVNRYLGRVGQPLPTVSLSQAQYDAAENVMAAVAAGRRTLVAELCARFGKTIWSGALVRECGARLTIVASYVLTSFASFTKDLSSFEQFQDLVVVDSADPDWVDQVEVALAGDFQVVVFLSMCAGGNRQAKIDWLFAQPHNRLVFVDEADFGAHRAGQSGPLIAARGVDDVVVLMTGTNGDRAASIWPVDHYLSVTYPQLLMLKNNSRLTAA